MPQPYLHDLVCAVRAPALAVSGADGQVRGEGVHGCYVGDRRILSRAVLTVDGVEPMPLAGHPVGGDRARFVAAVRTVHDDPTLLVRRDRHVMAGGVEERIEIVSYARVPVSATLGLELASDLADLGDVRAGSAPVPRPSDELTWRADDGTVVRVRADVEPDEATAGTLRWRVEIAPGATFAVTVTVTADDPGAVVAAARGPVFAAPRVETGEHRLPALVAQSVADLDALLLADPREPADTFLGAGVPWYLTLFGRDSIWAARMLLPLGTDLAAGTLRTLARRQGTREDAGTGEQPGKILHEIRRAPLELTVTSRAARQVIVPPVYYGTVDATPLWISLLHDAWRWGLPSAQVAELLPALEAALDWLAAATPADGFVAYRDTSGHGLANQGWKDSADAVQFRDGTLATPPIALCEVQAYTYAAARQGADLLDAFGRPGGARWRSYAAALAKRFRARFWVDGYPAIALDGTGRPVDTVTSNIGHLLGTGLLDDAESRQVAARLGSPDMDSGYGLRTMSSASAGFNPLSCHCGSVWPHDTAIAIDGLRGAAEAAGLIRGLLAAAPAFGYRLPELYSGDAPPVPYPSACRPQAWSATASIVMLSAVLGLRPDVPRGLLRLAPMRPSPVGELAVHGLRVAGEPLDVHLAADGMPDVVRAPAGLRVEIEPAPLR